MKPNSERQEEFPPSRPPGTGIRETLYSVTLTGWCLTGLFNAMDIYRPPAFTALWLLPLLVGLVFPIRNAVRQELSRVVWNIVGLFLAIPLWLFGVIFFEPFLRHVP